jgi:citrate lyase subunit beta/citryl-CoA lyase
VHIDIADVDGSRRGGGRRGLRLPGDGVHPPSQVAVIRGAYAPTAEQRAWAERVLDEATRRPGVFRFEGRMIDEPILRQARELVR